MFDEKSEIICVVNLIFKKFIKFFFRYNTSKATTLHTRYQSTLGEIVHKYFFLLICLNFVTIESAMRKSFVSASNLTRLVSS